MNTGAITGGAQRRNDRLTARRFPRVPGYISNGCVRLRNDDVLALGRRIQVGTPVEIR